MGSLRIRVVVPMKPTQGSEKFLRRRSIYPAAKLVVGVLLVHVFFPRQLVAWLGKNEQPAQEEQKCYCRLETCVSACATGRGNYRSKTQSKNVMGIVLRKLISAMEIKKREISIVQTSDMCEREEGEKTAPPPITIVANMYK